MELYISGFDDLVSTNTLALVAILGVSNMNALLYWWIALALTRFGDVDISITSKHSDVCYIGMVAKEHFVRCLGPIAV